MTCRPLSAGSQHWTTGYASEPYIMRKAALPVRTCSVLGTKWPPIMPLLSVP